jgi:hypothetical protein
VPKHVAVLVTYEVYIYCVLSWSYKLNCNYVVLCGCETWSHSHREEHDGVREHVTEEDIQLEKEVKGG